MESIKILVLSVAAAIFYGILHDQVTARVCVEYFTIAHPPVFRTTDPTLLAFGWGVIATWWVGVLLGLPMVCVARVGSRPKLNARDLVRPVAIAMGCLGVLAFVAGVVGFCTAEAEAEGIWMVGWAARIPPERQAAFLADAWAHSTSYAGGCLAGIVLWTWAWNRRGQLQRQAKHPEPPGTAVTRSASNSDGASR